VTVPSLKRVSRLNLPHHLDNNNNNDRDEPVRIFASHIKHQGYKLRVLDDGSTFSELRRISVGMQER
jgi:hypothetical protein